MNNSTPDLQALIEPDYSAIARSIADTAKKCGDPLSESQVMLLAAGIGVWCNKLIADALRQTAPALPGAGGGDALDGMFPGLQSDLTKLTTGARLMDNFENPGWNQQRESLESRVTAAASALMAHTEAAGMTLDKDGISIRIAPIAYEGEVS